MKLTDEQKLEVLEAAKRWQHNTTLLFAQIKRAVPGITDKDYAAVISAAEERKSLLNESTLESRAAERAAKDVVFIAAIESL